MLEDVPGALWQREWIDRDRVEKAPDLVRIVVAIDPAVTSGEDADETGIIVAGKGRDGHGYVLDDGSGRYPPHEWAAKAVKLYRERTADRIVAEVNNGGEMVKGTIHAIDPLVPFKSVHASRGKVVRAEPISAFYEKRMVHHVGSLAELEDQMCGFTSDFDRRSAGYSPDRVDALVWALTELLGGAQVYTADQLVGDRTAFGQPSQYSGRMTQNG
jgi:phage terminase large subunit-like protein